MFSSIRETKGYGLIVHSKMRSNEEIVQQTIEVSLDNNSYKENDSLSLHDTYSLSISENRWEKFRKRNENSSLGELRRTVTAKTLFRDEVIDQEFLDIISDCEFSRQADSNNSTYKSSQGISHEANVGEYEREDKNTSKSKEIKRRTTKSKNDKLELSPSGSLSRKKLFFMNKNSVNEEITPIPQSRQRMPYLHSMYIDDTSLVEFCGRSFNSPSDIKIALEKDPSLARRKSKDGRVALHTICVNGLRIHKTAFVSLRGYLFNFDTMSTTVDARYQTRKKQKYCTSCRKNGNDKLYSDSSIHEEEFTLPITLRALKEEVRNFRDALKILLISNKKAAFKADNNGDLPVHLLARHLWNWGKEMKLIERGRKHQKYMIQVDEISTLFKECIEVLLQPLINNIKLCHSKGSKGLLLPLHIGVMYNVSFHIILGLLNTYHESSEIATYGAIDGLQNLLPLDLHDKYQLLGEANKRKKYFKQTSDLIFSFNPDILPYRRESDRLERIEYCIKEEAMLRKKYVCRDVESLWLWLCTYSNDDDYDDHYAVNIRNIFKCLTFSAIQKLLLVKDDAGAYVMEIAVPPCAEVLFNYFHVVF